MLDLNDFYLFVQVVDRGGLGAAAASTAKASAHGSA